MGIRRSWVVVAGLVLVAGCGANRPVTASWRTELKKGAPIENYRLICVTPEGKAQFHNRDAGEDTRVFPYFDVAVGETFTLERQSRRRTVFQYTVERADVEKQEATVVVRRTEY